jgi:hypothetical protein
MSSMFRNVLTAVALGALGSACGAESASEEPSTTATTSGSLLSSPGWEVASFMSGTLNSDEFLDIITDASNNIYVAGYKNGRVGVSTIDPSGTPQGVIQRLNNAAQLTVYSTANIYNSKATVIEALAFNKVDGQLAFAGRTTGAFSAYGTTNKGQFDTIIGPVDLSNPSSPIFYVLQYGNARPQHPRRLAIDGNQKFVMAGYDDVYIPTNYVEAWEDSFLMRQDPNSTSQAYVVDWQANSPDQDMAFGLALDAQDNAYVSGSILGGFERGLYLKKFNKNGVLSWSNRLSPMAMDVGSSVEMAPDGNVLFGGGTYVQLGEQQYGDMDVVVKKLDPNGVAIAGWGSNFSGTTQYGSNSTDWVTDMAVDASGNIYVVGETLGSFDPSVPNQGNSDVFVLKLNAAGRCPQVFQIGSPGQDRPTAVTVDSQGRILVAGFTTGSLQPTVTNKGSRDGFVLRLTAPSSGPCL